MGTIKNGICGLSDIGNETVLYLQQISERNKDVVLDEFIIMPNHLHCIIIIEHCNHIYTGNRFSNSVPRSVSTLINHFKGAVTTWCKQNDQYFNWQSKFHDHVIRDEKKYWAIKNYITNNPANWKNDKFHPLGHAMACPNCDNAANRF